MRKKWLEKMNRTKHEIKGKEWRRGSGDIEEINTRNTASQCPWPCLLAAQMLFPSRSGDASNRKGGFSGTFNGVGFKLYPIWTLRRRKTLVVHLCNVALFATCHPAANEAQADVSALHHRPRISSFVCADDGRSSSRSETRVGYIMPSAVLVLLPWPNELCRTRSRASRLS